MPTMSLKVSTRKQNLIVHPPVAYTVGWTQRAGKQHALLVSANSQAVGARA